jgi:Helix-turn-helix domain
VSLPLYISRRELAARIGVQVDTVSKWCRTRGLGRRIGGRWYVTREQVIAAFPDAFQRHVGIDLEPPPMVPERGER